MKDRSTAALLAIAAGWTGAHRWYLGQVGRAILCIVFFPITFFTAPAVGIYWLLSSRESFDANHNANRIQRDQAAIQREILAKLGSKVTTGKE